MTQRTCGHRRPAGSGRSRVVLLLTLPLDANFEMACGDKVSGYSGVAGEAF